MHKCDASFFASELALLDAHRALGSRGGLSERQHALFVQQVCFLRTYRAVADDAFRRLEAAAGGKWGVFTAAVFEEIRAMQLGGSNSQVENIVPGPESTQKPHPNTSGDSLLAFATTALDHTAVATLVQQTESHRLWQQQHATPTRTTRNSTPVLSASPPHLVAEEKFRPRSFPISANTKSGSMSISHVVNN